MQGELKKIDGDTALKFDYYELPNGLKVVLSEDHTIPSVAINVCYHVGSKNEKPDKRGYAHLFEHLMFEGSKHLKAGEYDRISVFAGGENNAYTTEDKTNYYLLLPSNQLELGLWLESDRLLGCAVTKKSLEIQKGVITEEKNQNCDNRPYGTVNIEFAPKLYKNSGYSWDTIGDMAEVQNANMDDIREFYYSYYIPNNTVLSICGDINIAETKELVEKYFGEISKGKDVVRPEFNELPLNGESRKIIYDDIQFPGIFIGYRIPGEFTKESVSLEILSEILAGGESSKLYRELVYEKQLSNEIASYVDNKESTGVFYIYSVLMPDVETGEVEKIIDRIIDDTGKGMISDKEIEKAKNRIETKLTYKKQSILYKADLFAHFTCFYGNPGMINEILKVYLSVSKDDIIRTVNTYLNMQNRVILTYLPKQ